MNEHGNNDGNRPISGRRRARCRLQGIALSVLCLFFAACAQTFPDGDVLERYPDGGVPIRLTVSLPQSAFPEKRTKVEKASDETENRIEEMRILVFERNESGYAYRYMVEAEQLQSSGTGVLFQAKLLSTPNPVKLMLVGNYGDAFAVYAPSPGDSEADVKAGTGCSFGESLRSLPMYGQIVIPSGLEVDRENRYSVKMLRAAARVDVEKDLAADSRPLRIESVRVYRANDKIQIAPDEAVDEESPRVAAPSVFAGAVKSQTPIVTTAGEPDPVSIAGIYLPEADGETDPSAQLTEATRIVVGGYYDGGSSPTYYRIDFNPGLEGHPFGQILRNYRYVFRIRKVTGPGWSDPALAAVNRAASIVAEIRPWENFTTEMYFEGDNYFGLSSRNVTLGYQAGRVDTVDVQTTVPYAIQWLDTSGTPVGSAVSGVGASLPDNGGFTVAIARNSDDAETVTRLIFTTTGDNRTQSEATAGLRITAGRWTLDVSVKQESPEKYRKRFIRVLSVTEVGSFGTNNPAAASGQPLRRILDNAKNFSPSGTVIVGGFSFTEASRAEIQATSMGSGSDIFQNVKNTINTQDVIYLTYNSPISDELAKVVLSWLRSSPNRVLIVGTDTDATNANLRSYLTADGTWKYYNQSPAVGGKFKRAAQTDGNRRFFTSPFGTVAENAPIARADDYAGYCLNYPAGVTPLVVSDAVGYEKAMIVGVNRQDRIVYHGDANLNQNGRLSSQANANGSVTSDFDRLTANLWAWIVEQVCEQE